MWMSGVTASSRPERPSVAKELSQREAMGGTSSSVRQARQEEEGGGLGEGGWDEEGKGGGEEEEDEGGEGAHGCDVFLSRGLEGL